LLSFIYDLFPLDFVKKHKAMSNRHVAFYLPILSSLMVRDFNTFKQFRSNGLLDLSSFFNNPDFEHVLFR